MHSQAKSRMVSLVVTLLCLVFAHWANGAFADVYYIGTGRYDITGPAAETEMVVIKMEREGGDSMSTDIYRCFSLRWAMPCPSRSATGSTLDSTAELSSWQTLSIGLGLYLLMLISVWELRS